MTYTLDLADCHEWLKALPDASVDAVITDPPYHTTALAYDALPVRWAELWPEIYRVCKPSAVQVMFSAQPFTTDLINSNRRRYRYDLIWPKTVATGFLDANLKPLRAHEHVLVFAENPKQTTYNPQMTQGRGRGLIRRDGQAGHYGKGRASSVDTGQRYPRSVLPEHGRPMDNIHPSQKPLELLAYLVKTYSNPGDLIIDPFAGSGTTGAACLQTGRRFMGCEIGPAYHTAATARLEALAAQGSLFSA